MTDMVPFVYGQQQVRTVLVDGEPWFVAADVCAVLGLANVTDALTRLDDDERALVSIDGPNGRSLNAVSEAGLYSLILGSRKPIARPFKRWVTHEVLPTLHRERSYSLDRREPPTPRELTRRELAQMVIDAEDRVAELEPAAEQFNRWQSSPDTVYVVEWAKTIGLTQQEAYRALRACDVLFKQQHEGMAFNVPKRAYERYFHLIDEYLSGPRRWTKVTKITAEGQTVLAELLLENGWIAP